MKDRVIAEGDIDRLLGALIQQTRLLAGRIAGDSERETPCHFCGWPAPLWECLLVMQLAGVPAHAQCPAEALRSRLSQYAPDDAFPYATFSRDVERRMSEAAPVAACGVIATPS